MKLIMEKLPILLIIVVFVNLTTPTVIRNGRLSGSDRMNDPKIQQCLLSTHCMITLDLTPTCASDGKTYPNRGSIACLNECLKPDEKVTIVSGGYCEADIEKSR